MSDKPDYPPDFPGDFMFLSDDILDLFESRVPHFRTDIGFGSNQNFVPSVNILEGCEDIALTVEVPGISREEISISVEGDILTVSGSRNLVKENPEEEYIRLERKFGVFRRTFKIPKDVDTDSIKAVLENGVLTIRIPKQSGSRTIEVKTSE